jgi:hypothetical protein
VMAERLRARRRAAGDERGEDEYGDPHVAPPFAIGWGGAAGRPRRVRRTGSPLRRRIR